MAGYFITMKFFTQPSFEKAGRNSNNSTIEAKIELQMRHALGDMQGISNTNKNIKADS